MQYCEEEEEEEEEGKLRGIIHEIRDSKAFFEE